MVFWAIVGCCGWLMVTMGRCGSLWHFPGLLLVVIDCLNVVVGCCVLFVGQFYWVVLGGFGGLMEIVGVCDVLLGDFWSPWMVSSWLWVVVDRCAIYIGGSWRLRVVMSHCEWFVGGSNKKHGLASPLYLTVCEWIWKFTFRFCSWGNHAILNSYKFFETYAHRLHQGVHIGKIWRHIFHFC